ncbi:MAG: hypothetical protein IBJ03_02330 [Gemmatimonadaceae bacterium]|nr:hypothetical protein [Gemmatimonadaceae bacterium]
MTQSTEWALMRAASQPITISGTPMAQNAQEAIASYITDMLALEEHMEKAFAGQLTNVKEGRFAGVIHELKAVNESHLRSLRDLADRRKEGGQGIAEAIKGAASSVLGMGAAAIDLVRSEKLPKNLRDDYAAVSLATIGYLMLHTTAEALSDAEVSQLALTHLRDYAKATMTLFHAVPDSVVAFLSEEGFRPADGVANRVNATADGIWRSGAS